ncbi:MAG: thioredoxin domain-containing protein [Proteobacteria bacterium]|nr:thioredoxin domain-containing protein [Pseudomonadota bacterium]
MHRIYLSLILCLSLILLTNFARAQTPTCKKLKGSQKALAAELLATQYPYACCDDTIANCLNQKPTCSLVYRLSENICAKVAEKQDRASIVRGLSRRARSMMPGKKASIDLSGSPAVGEQRAPVTLVEYACARCPYCARITPKLYHAVASGQLKGKVKLYFKTFPIRGHESSKETGLGFIAANKLGRFWEFLLHSYEHFDSFCVLKQADWAEAAGMERNAFERTVADPVTRKLLVDSKKEGIVNKVDATPTFFINGRKYVGDINLREIIDVLEEEYERVKGIQYRRK